MSQKIQWGILGTGSIAHKFATGLSFLSDAELVAVGSRNIERADQFANRFDIPNRHSSYESLVSDPNVDIIYVATPHNLHHENTQLCLESGKAVICEKPFAINADQATRMIESAQAEKLFLMEAMWTRYLPLMVELRTMLAENLIGEVRMLTADFGFRAGLNPEGRLFTPKLGGGALLDVGVYTVSLSSMIFGSPTQVVSLAHLGETGVDEQAGIVLGHAQNELAILHTAIRTSTPQEAIIMGTQGRIRIHSPWWIPNTMTIELSGKPPETTKVPYEGNGYHYEASEAMNCLRSNKLESDTMPLSETISIMQTLDQIRDQWGLKYPMEE